jgi:hypothetical protein
MKIIRQFREGKKNFQRRQITENIIENHYFSKSKEQLTYIRPCLPVPILYNKFKKGM